MTWLYRLHYHVMLTVVIVCGVRVYVIVTYHKCFVVIATYHVMLTVVIVRGVALYRMVPYYTVISVGVRAIHIVIIIIIIILIVTMIGTVLVLSVLSCTIILYGIAHRARR